MVVQKHHIRTHFQTPSLSYILMSFSCLFPILNTYSPKTNICIYFSFPLACCSCGSWFDIPYFLQLRCSFFGWGEGRGLVSPSLGDWYSWFRYHHVVWKRRTPITPWRGATFQKQGDHNRLPRVQKIGRRTCSKIKSHHLIEEIFIKFLIYGEM